jgi:hypothetical protein
VNLMDTPPVILIALSVGMPGFLMGIAAIVAVCRADKHDLVEIVRALMKVRTTPPGTRPEAIGSASPPKTKGVGAAATRP